MKSSNPAPVFPKGTLVRPAGPRVEAWRRASPEERQAWYERHAEDVRAGRDTWHDSGGESRLAPTDAYFTVTPEMTLTVVRGRVAAPLGYGKAKDCCAVFCPDNGETLFIRRRNLTDRW